MLHLTDPERTAGIASAQTAYVPYFGKNQIRYDNFDWHTYQTEHFEIYYYPEIEPHLERIAGYAESAYQHVSSELKHDLSMKLPLILFSTIEKSIPILYCLSDCHFKSGFGLFTWIMFPLF